MDVETWKDRHLVDVQPWIQNGSIHQDFNSGVDLDEAYYWRVTYEDHTVLYQYDEDGSENAFPADKVRSGDVRDIFWVPRSDSQPAIGLRFDDADVEPCETGAVRTHARKVPMTGGGVIRNMTVYVLKRHNTETNKDTVVGVAETGKVLTATHKEFPFTAVFEDLGVDAKPL